MASKKKNNKKPVSYEGGGFLKGTGQFLKNAGLAVADTGLSAVGANDVIGEDQYIGDHADQWTKGTDIAGQVAQAGVQVGLNTVLPGAGQVAGVVQNQVGKATEDTMTDEEKLAIQYANAGMPFVQGYANSMVTNPQDNMMAYGGDMNNEGNMGQLTEYNAGGSHEQNPNGGIPLGQNAVVEEGETQLNAEDYVFSDRINLPGKKRLTFADQSKKINDKFSLRLDDTLDEAEKKRQLTELMTLQEEVKKREIQKYLDSLQELGYSPEQPNMPQQSFMYGGKKYMAFGGGTGEPPTGLAGATMNMEEDLAKNFYSQFNPVNPMSPNPNMNPYDFTNGYMTIPNAPVNQPVVPSVTMQQDYDPTVDPLGDTNPDPSTEVILKDQPIENTLKEGAVNTPNATTGTPDNSYGQNIGLTGLQMASQYAPIVANLAGAIKKEDRLDANDYQIDYSKVNPATLNVNPTLRKNEQTFGATEEYIKGASAGNAGAYMANVGQAGVGKQSADYAALIGKENYDANQKSVTDQFNARNELQVNAINKNREFQVDDWNARSKANRYAMLQDAAYNLQGLGQADINNMLALMGIKGAYPNYAPTGNISYLPSIKKKNP